ncbi:NADPH-dependent ferric siderophore reductase [Allocatelliglobosispora scoriae]|uniref:NADPH-dependent ferric siderophore reductase n=1 Tax=Allocatelliglobosispora scoriae TaxID=643052 RepID=A0A841C1S7_9ACTN|nr:siderophore-interacting protein [Allocatelliglobosispora scoriae]MBB5873708.1 NADPH-dependent ferric siderophore reductase [Allocatelliglobosispora scoriae]
MTGLAERLADLASGAMLDTARVTGLSRLSAEFLRVELSADAFRKATWVPGAKLQFRPRRGSMGLRTYTPIGWDADRGATELIAYTHGDGPAAEWFERVAVGTECGVFGPRRSIDLRDPAGPVVFVGDETSVALAAALRTVTGDVSHVFEARDPAGLTGVLAGLGITERVAVVVKTADRVELLRQARDAAVRTAYTLVVTGDAATVHAVRRDARGWPSTPGQVKGKAYWAEGRTGLD